MYITKFTIQKLWNRLNIDWSDINLDVNILVGINGVGKTTLLNMIYNYYTSSLSKDMKGRVEGTPVTTDTPFFFIQSFDVAIENKKKKNSPLLAELESVVLQNKEKLSLFNYRMRAINYPQEAQRIQTRINSLFGIFNDYFSETNKTIEIDKDTNLLVFRIGKDTTIPMEYLSAGEKQLMLILLTVFLQDEKPAILLMDEPELSLHISWQNKLLYTIRQLNPKCQIILSTHSPSIFANGWEGKLTFMEDISKEVQS